MRELLSLDDMNANDEADMPVHEQFMRRCIELAHAAQSQGNTPVGSIVVLGGEIVGEGAESLPAGDDITGHVEILACQAAVSKTGSRDLSDAVLYSTAEPCFMCSFAIRQSAIALVVQWIAQHQPFMNIRSLTYPICTGVEARVTIEGDVFEMEDQRNWTDASFKTYSTPLELPFPAEVAAGSRIEQVVTLELLGMQATTTSQTSISVRSPVELHV